MGWGWIRESVIGTRHPRLDQATKPHKALPITLLLCPTCMLLRTHPIDKLASASCSRTRSVGSPDLADCDLELYAFDAPFGLHSQVLKL